MVLNLFSNPKTEEPRKTGGSNSRIEGSFNGREDALKSAKSVPGNDLAKTKETISNFLLDQKNLKNLSTDQVKMYHEILGSPEFKVALTSVDSKGQSLAQTLSRLTDNDKSKTCHLDRGLLSAFNKSEATFKSEATLKTELLTSILDKVKTSGFTNQGLKNTCLIAEVESQAFNENPAEVSRMVIELATKGRYEIQRGNQKLQFNLPVEHLNKEEPNTRFVPRNVFEQVFQESSAITLLRSIGGDASSYDSETTGWSVQKSSGEYVDLHGKFAAQGELLYSMLTGKGHAILDKTNGSKLQSTTLSALENLQAGNELSFDPATKTLTGCDFKAGLIVHLRWAPDGGSHAKHCVKAMGVYTDPEGEKFVIIGNTHYEQGCKPKSVFEINRGSPPHQRLEMMPLSDFQARLEEAHIPDGSNIISIAAVKNAVRNAVDNCENGGYYIQNNVIMLTVPVNHQAKSTADMSSVEYRTAGEIGTKEHDTATLARQEVEAAKVVQLKTDGLSLQEIHLRVKNARNGTKSYEAEIKDGEGPDNYKNRALFGIYCSNADLFTLFKHGKN